jgi:transposase
MPKTNLDKGVTNSTIPSIDFNADLTPIVNVPAGIDVHKNILVCSVIKRDGSVETRSFGTLKKDVKSMSNWLVESGVEKAAMESTGVYWKNPFYQLKEDKVDVILVNAHHVKNVPGRKTDTLDSIWLAKLTRAGLLQLSRSLPKSQDELRESSRLRKSTVEMLTAEKSRVHKLLVKGGFAVNQVVTDLFGASGQIMIAGLINGHKPDEIFKDLVNTVGYRLKSPKEKVLDALESTMSETLRLQLHTQLVKIDQLNDSIAKFDEQMEQAVEELGQAHKLEILETIPGVSKVAAMTLLLELGFDLTSFRSAEALASWAGMAPGNNESAGKRKTSKTTRGNKYVKRILCEVASSAVKTESYFRMRFNTLRVRLPYKKAIVSIGCKILKIIYSMLTNNEPYWDNSLDYEELVTKKNASRWIRMLRKFNCLEPKTRKA